MTPLRAKLEYRAITTLALLFRTLPLPAARALARSIGWTAARALGIRRKTAIENLTAAFPNTTFSELRNIYVRCWQHFLCVAAEMARLPRMSTASMQRRVDVSRLPVIESALKYGRGLIVVSGHFGNWEWMGAMVSLSGLPVSYVVTSQTNPLAERWLDEMRRSVGVEIIARQNAVKGTLAALKRNRIVAILCDQDAGATGVFVRFFGRLASAPRGPALFHIRTGSPIVFASAPLTPGGKYAFQFEVMDFGKLSADRDENERMITAAIAARLEAEVRKYPEQWLWLHRRWKTEPG